MGTRIYHPKRNYIGVSRQDLIQVKGPLLSGSLEVGSVQTLPVDLSGQEGVDSLAAFVDSCGGDPWRLLCSSVLVRSCFLIGD